MAIQNLKVQLELPPLSANPELALLELEKQIDGILPEQASFSPDEARLLCQAISRYQFYYFLRPNRDRMHKWKQYMMLFDHLAALGGYSRQDSQGKDFYDLRDLLEWVDHRNSLSQERLERLLLGWKQNPEKLQQFLKQLNTDEEVGGIIREDEKKAMSWEFIEDEQREQLRQALNEFKQNRFENLDFLESIFLKRLALQKKKTPVSSSYSANILKGAKHHFEKIRQLSSQKDSSTLAEIEKSKNTLLFLGLETLLLKWTYTIDKTPFLKDPQLAFFFHSHPYHSGHSIGPKKPSRHDEEMSFRIGPCLVFDVQKNYISLYLVMEGKGIYINSLPAF